MRYNGHHSLGIITSVLGTTLRNITLILSIKRAFEGKKKKKTIFSNTLYSKTHFWAFFFRVQKLNKCLFKTFYCTNPFLGIFIKRDKA
jgi:hypothetical protein